MTGERAGGHRHRLTAGLLLGIAMGVANVMSYAFMMLLSTTLRAEVYGGFAALNSYGVILSIPAGAFQIVVARRHSAGATGPGHGALTTAASVGGLIGAATIALAPAITAGLHLPSVWAAVWLGLLVPAMTVTGTFQGVLLGRERLGALSLLYLTTAATRLAAAAVTVVLDLGLAEVFAAMFVAAGVTCLVGAWLCRGLVGRPDPSGQRFAVLRELMRSNLTLAALITLSSIDVVLARHHLSRQESGDYALAALFGRLVFWGTQFVALSIVPAVGEGAGRRTLHRAGLLVLALGAAVAGICSAVPHLLVSVTGGPTYVGAEDLLVWSATLGTLWAVIQVWLFAEMGRDRHTLSLLTWGAVAAEVALVTLWLHDTPMEVLGAAALSAAAVALVGAVLVPRGEPVPAPGSPEVVEAVTADARE